jgi:hypothetical protein
MGHCGKFGYALWAIAANLVVRYGPLRQIWLYAMGHCGGFVCAKPITIAQNYATVFKSLPYHLKGQ